MKTHRSINLVLSYAACCDTFVQVGLEGVYGGGTRSVLTLGFHDTSHANLKTKIENSTKRGPATGIILGVPSTYPVCLQRVPKCTHNSVPGWKYNSVPGYRQQRTRGYTAIKSQKIQHVAKRRTRPCTLLINQLGQLITAKRIRKIRSQLS